jgi:transcriptional regulator with XRE-family HTH domain
MPKKKAPPPSEVFVDQLREARGRRGRAFNQAVLASRLAKLGYTGLGRSGISKIEARLRERGVSLDEALAIAFALGVAPVELFTPADDAAEVAVVPRFPLPAHQARGWLRGTNARFLGEEDERFYSEFVSLTEWKSFQRDGVRALVDHAEALRHSAEWSPEVTSEVLDSLERDIERVRQALDEEEAG